MENSKALVYSGHLVYVHQSKGTPELESYRFSKQTDFYSELVTKSTLTSRSKLHWNIRDVRNIVDDRSGIQTPVILASHVGKRERLFCVIQTKWSSTTSSGCVTSHKHTTDDTDHDGTGDERADFPRKSVHLVPLISFTCNTSLTDTTDCALLYGPRVLVTNHNKLSLFSLNSKSESKNSVYSVNEFNICDDVHADVKQSDLDAVGNNLNGVDNHGDKEELESTILCVVSEKNWFVTVLRMKTFGGKYSLATVGVERLPENVDFNKYTLRTSDFFPHEYASKVSSMIIDHCQRMRTGNEVPVFRNTCAIGLSDGYVLTLADGVVQVCVTPWTHIDAAYPAFGVTDLLKFGRGILVCLTDTKHCFIIDETTKQVKHHWDGVTKALVGDFLQCGGLQLLLLFSSCLAHHPPDNFLLTDLQGFVADRRKNDCDASLSEENFPAEDDEASKNLRPVLNALVEQNQALARRVAEEKQKLASKQTFVADTWTRLMDLSLRGAGNLPDVSPPEVPLTSLVGYHSGIKLTDRRRQTSAEPPGDIQVHSVWHRLLDGACVVGVNITNVSDRELFHCALTLTPHTASQTRSCQNLSAVTTVWQSLRTQPATATPPSPHANPHKRQKTESSLHVRQTQAIQPSESVTVTCVLDTPDLGWHGELAYHVNLVYEVKERNDSFASSREDASDVVHRTGVTKRMAAGKAEEQVTRCGQRQGVKSLSLKSARSVKNALCGKVGLKASELLQQKQRFDPLVDDEWEQSDPVPLEELLTLSSIQQQWQCEVDFVLHEAAEVIGPCLQTAGFVYRSQLGQHWMPARAPACLQGVRVQLLGFAPLPRRAASIMVFARDSNQLMILLRHLYTHLPDDATISLATADPNTHVQHLLKLLTAQLCERKRQAQALLEAHKSPPHPISQSTKKPHTAEGNGVNGETSRSSENKAESQAEEFASLQLQYQQQQSRSVRGEDVARFKAAVLGCEMDTDMAVAKVKL